MLEELAGCLPALLWEDALGANGSIDLADLLGGAHQQRGARVGDGLAAALAGLRVAAADVDGVQVELPVGTPCHGRPARTPSMREPN